MGCPRLRSNCCSEKEELDELWRWRDSDGLDHFAKQNDEQDIAALKSKFKLADALPNKQGFVFEPGGGAG